MATGTAVDVVMPQMGVSVSEGTITKWLKAEGEPIAADEPLLEISTDKVDTEVPSPAEGVLGRILAQEGETVPVGTVIATISPVGAQMEALEEELPPAAPVEEVPEPATQEAAAEASAASSAEQIAAPAPEAPEPQEPAPSAPAPPAPAPAQPVPAAPTGEADAAEEDGDGRAFVSPVVARIAAEHGVNVSDVPGTGRGGRVTKKDILDFIEAEPARQAAVVEEAAAVAEAAPAPPSVAEPTAPVAPAVAEPAPAPTTPAPLRPRPLPPRRSPARERSTSR